MRRPFRRRDRKYIISALCTIIEKENLIMTAQSDINAAVAALGSFLANVETAVTEIKAELEDTDVDTSGLDSVVAELPAVQSAIDALVSSPVTASTSASTSTSTSASASTAADFDPAKPAPGLI
jgi:hypothetical protein